MAAKADFDARGTLARLARHKDCDNGIESGITQKSFKLRIEWRCPRVSIFKHCGEKSSRHG